MIGGNGVTEKTEAVSIFDWRKGWRNSWHALEEWWVLNIGRVVPLEKLSFWAFEFIPSLVSCEGLTVEFFEQLWLNNSLNYLFNFVSEWPDILEEDIASISSFADWLSLEIDVASSSQAVCYDQRWGCEVVGSGEWMNSTLKVSITGKD